jgi:hypothetical protein
MPANYLLLSPSLPIPSFSSNAVPHNIASPSRWLRSVYSEHYKVRSSFGEICTEVRSVWISAPRLTLCRFASFRWNRCDVKQYAVWIWRCRVHRCEPTGRPFSTFYRKRTRLIHRKVMSVCPSVCFVSKTYFFLFAVLLRFMRIWSSSI